MADVKKKVTKKTNTKAVAKKPVQKRPVIISADAIGPFYEYTMGRSSAYDITHDVEGRVVKEAKGREQAYLVDYVNEQYGLMGTCIRVNVVA